jgi:hypothetical protein
MEIYSKAHNDGQEEIALGIHLTWLCNRLRFYKLNKVLLGLL